MKKGIVYGVGVGPGDPELMTLKAVRLIRENGVIAYPKASSGESLAYRIAVQSVPELAGKELLPIDMPMVREGQKLLEAHKTGASLIASHLDAGENVVYLTLGDPTVYCSFLYLKDILEEDGYQVELVSGIPSFCAAAARLGISLAEQDEALHIIPAAGRAETQFEQPGNYVLMKTGRQLKDVKALLAKSGLDAFMIENCGMESEKIFRGVEEIPDSSGYFSLIIAKEYNK